MDAVSNVFYTVYAMSAMRESLKEARRSQHLLPRKLGPQLSSFSCRENIYFARSERLIGVSKIYPPKASEVFSS